MTMTDRMAAMGETYLVQEVRATADWLTLEEKDYSADVCRRAGLALEHAAAREAKMQEALVKARIAVATWSPDPTEPLQEIDAALGDSNA